MKTMKMILSVWVMFVLIGCQNIDSKEFDEVDFYSNVRDALSEITVSTRSSSISTNLEFSERMQQKINVLNIKLMDESEVISKLDFKSIITDIKNGIDLETLRLNYDLIHISFIITNDNHKVVYEYVNMTNTFARGDSSLTDLIIENKRE